jgi:hypothetical protein
MSLRRFSNRSPRRRQLIWDRLDKIHAKPPDIVSLNGGSQNGAELVASKWLPQAPCRAQAD